MKPISQFENAIAALKVEIQHWTDDRETDPEWSDMMVAELKEAIEVLEKQ